MNAPLITVPTLDHGLISIPEPAWCVGHRDQPRGFRVDLSHCGPEIPLGPAGDPLFIASLTQHPFSDSARQIGLLVDPVDITSTYTPGELDELAAGLVEAATQLRHQARWLSVLQGGAR